MADNSALYGLLGALGGASAAGLAAVYGPLRLHRRQAEQKASEEQTRQSETEIARLLKMRTTGRAWIDALERFVQDLQTHHPVDVNRFDEITAHVRQEATEAGHALAHNGLWLGSEDTHPRGIPRLDTADGSFSQLLGRLREATWEVRADVLRCSSDRESTVRSEVLEALEYVRAARAQLNAALLDQIDQINGGHTRRL
ncbi:hypothetical protein ACFU7Y_22000 [Kitasatospora sp. NPDC057542]|uniref:hypothetical protein n=1 Tax=Kitasatospora sp. NPDC057542 TaxID=3346162 RepID=UPI00368986E6